MQNVKQRNVLSASNVKYVSNVKNVSNVKSARVPNKKYVSNVNNVLLLIYSFLKELMEVKHTKKSLSSKSQIRTIQIIPQKKYVPIKIKFVIIHQIILSF